MCCLGVVVCCLGACFIVYLHYWRVGLWWYVICVALIEAKVIEFELQMRACVSATAVNY